METSLHIHENSGELNISYRSCHFQAVIEMQTGYLIDLEYFVYKIEENHTVCYYSNIHGRN